MKRPILNFTIFKSLVLLLCFGRLSAEPLVITTSEFPIAYKEILYTAQLTASGGTPPLSWSSRKPKIPPSVCPPPPSPCNLPCNYVEAFFPTLNENTGKISGLPDECSKSGEIGVTLTDASGQTVSKSFKIEVLDKTTVSVSRIGGISTNALVNTTAADYMVAGVFITGGAKRLVVRGVSVDGGIINPRLTVQTFPDGKIIGSNDDWQKHASASEVQQAGYAPTNSKDAAMVVNLNPGLYTFTVSPEGVKGKAIVEVYELETGATNKIGGISTNAVVGTNAADYMIAGVFISGTSKKVMVRASSVDGVDPKLTVQSYPDATVLYTNSSWQSDSSAAQVQQLGYAPAKTTDAAMVITLPQGLFTFTVSPEGAGGKGIIEVYEVN